MEHPGLIARLLSEVATARTAITGSYMRLWRSEATASGGPGGGEHGAEPRSDAALDPVCDERSSEDVS